MLNLFEIIERLSKLGFELKSVADIWLTALAENRAEPERLVNYRMVFNLFLDHYETEVFFKKLEPIEQLPKEDKLEYWNQTEVMATEKEKRIQCVKVLYIIDHLIAKKYKL